jgi:hypothetical protein
MMPMQLILQSFPIACTRRGAKHQGAFEEEEEENWAWGTHKKVHAATNLPAVFLARFVVALITRSRDRLPSG